MFRAEKMMFRPPDNISQTARILRKIVYAGPRGQLETFARLATSPSNPVVAKKHTVRTDIHRQVGQEGMHEEDGQLVKLLQQHKCLHWVHQLRRLHILGAGGRAIRSSTLWKSQRSFISINFSLRWQRCPLLQTRSQVSLRKKSVSRNHGFVKRRFTIKQSLKNTLICNTFRLIYWGIYSYNFNFFLLIT